MVRLPDLKSPALLFASRTKAPAPTPGNHPPILTATDPVQPTQALDALLDNVEQGAIRYFIEQRTANGLVMDRAPLVGEAQSGMASLAATGFGMAAWVLAMEKGMLSRRQAREWVMQTLETVEKITGPEQKGWLAHFVDPETGAIWPGTEISSIDTVLFFLGAITAGEAFGGAVRRKVQALFNRIDFPAMLTDDGTRPDQKAFSLGFMLEPGNDGTLPGKTPGVRRVYIPHRWDEYSEGMLVPLLALGATRHKVPDSVWTEGWQRAKRWQDSEHKTFVNLPLFTYFYPHAFLDLKGKVDARGDNFWKASQDAVALQQAYCRKKGYPKDFFGITACDGPQGYLIYSAMEFLKPGSPDKVIWRFDDGTVAPAAIMACLPFAETQVRKLLGPLQGEGLLDTRYGASCGYNVDSGWRAPEAVGIDLGSMLLMIDAYRRGRIHELTGQSQIIRRAMKRAGFQHAPTP